MPASNQDPRLQLVPASGRSRTWLWLLGAGLPVALSVVVPLLGRSVSPAGLFSAHWEQRLWAGVMLPHVLLAPMLVAAIALVACVLLDRLLRRQRVQLDDVTLDITSTFYRRRVPLAQLQLAQARVLSLGEHPELRPWLKVNGYALPGFRSGWYRTRGFKKVFVASAGGDRLLWLPVRDAPALLLQPLQPQQLLERLRTLASPHGAR